MFPSAAPRGRLPGAPPRGRKSVRRREILEAALRCFNAAGYEWTTIRDICEESGASIGSVYHLFDEKQSIAGALYLDGIREWVARVVTAIREAADPETAARAAVHAYVGWMSDNPQWYAFCAVNRVLARRSALRPEVTRVFRGLDRAIAERFAPAVARGEVVSLPATAYRPLLLGPTYSIAIDRLCAAAPDDPPEAWLPDAAECAALADSAWQAVRR